MKARDAGLDLVEVDSHAGARPGCEPYQGKVYSLSGNTEGYDKLSETSYGDLDGLFGINCGHNMYPYQPGTERTYKPYPKSENEETYKNSQRQRYLERQIRAAKRQREVATGEEDKRKAQALLANRQKAMRNFIDDTGRTRLREREQIQ